MTTLHLQTESGYQTAAVLKQNAAQALEEAQALQRAIQTLASAWQGGAQAEFTYEANAVVRQLQNQIALLQTLAERLQREIREWEDVDQRGAASWRGLFPSAMVWLPGSGGGAPAVSAAWPLFATFSIGSWLSNLPAWLNAWLGRLFLPASIPSPVSLEAEPPKGRLAETVHNGFARLEQEHASSSGQAAQRLPIVEEQKPAPSSASPAPAPSYAHDVPFLSQHGLKYQGEKTDYGCVPASVSMILNYWHNQDSSYAARSPQELLDLNAQQREFHAGGMSPSNLVEDVKQLGYSDVQTHPSASWEQFSEDVKKGPVVALVKLGMGVSGYNHAVVVTGISEDGSKVMVNDPWSGSREYSVKTFQSSWQAVQSAYMVIRP